MFVDAFSGETLDLKTQTATVQYKSGARRTSVLQNAKDFERVDAAAQKRQRRGSTRAEFRVGAVDASELLRAVLAEPAAGHSGGKTCALVIDEVPVVSAAVPTFRPPAAIVPPPSSISSPPPPKILFVTARPPFIRTAPVVVSVASVVS